MTVAGIDRALDVVPPALPEVYVERRGEQFLVLNARGPHWFVSDGLTALFADLCDGHRSLHEIAEAIRAVRADVTTEEVVASHERLARNGFYGDGTPYDVTPLTTVFFNITRVCNLSCPFCYYDSGPDVREHKLHVLSADDWIDLARRVRDVNPAARITVSGGEPFVHPEAMRIVEEITALGLGVSVYTNGTLVTRERAERLGRLPGVRVQLSVDSIVEAENAQSRGPRSLAKALAGLDHLIDHGVPTTVSATVTAINRESTHLLREYCEQRGVRFRTSMFFLAGERSKDNADSLALDPEEEWQRAAASFDTGTVRTFVSTFRSGRRKTGCGVGHGILAVNPDGSVSPCNHLPDPALSIGNVRASDWLDILRAGRERYAVVDVDRTPPGGCSTCYVRYLCGGGCKASSLHTYGRFDTPPPDCSFLWRTAVDALWADVLGDRYAEVATVPGLPVGDRPQLPSSLTSPPRRYLPLLSESPCSACPPGEGIR